MPNSISEPEPPGERGETPLSTTPSINQSIELSALQVLLVGGIPVATTVAGALMLIASGSKDPIVPNPYIALFTFLVGIAFIITAVVAIREQQSG